MGVDYSGNYGIGVKLIEPEEFPTKHIEDMPGYVDFIMESVDMDLHYFEVGDGSYTGKTDDFYLCISDPFVMGVFQQQKAIDFINYLKENNIKYEGSLDSVGGLNIW